MASLSDARVNVAVRTLHRIMRDGPGTNLEEAEQEALLLVGDDELITEAVRRVRAEIERQNTEPKVPVIRGSDFTPWYPGPVLEVDRCWRALNGELQQRLSEDALRQVDETSSKIVANLSNPAVAQRDSCRGLVLGYVQSGKTTNFTAVIAKAADAGYRLFIVLSGIHNSLRQQTQDRLSEQLWAPNADLWNRLTEESDFRPVANNVDAVLAGNSKVLIVAKKNAPRLRALKKWLLKADARVLARCPILIIDDEADQASVNTAKPDEAPKAINGLIRDIVNINAPVSYVGYTATPFANVLIDTEDGDDLYPRDFMLSLPRPDGYLGPETLFGREPLDLDDEAAEPVDDGYDMVRTVPDTDVEELRPPSAAERFGFEATVPESLDEALRYFLLSTAARRVRGAGNKHATALIHTSQHVETHEAVAQAVRDHLEDLSSRLGAGQEDLHRDLRDQWEVECDRVVSSEFDLPSVPWGELMAVLPDVADEVRVITDNSRSLERLKFDDDEPGVVVAVGGNTLSRGLTLEGLAVSYFVRSASAYDTVLQMGRWFGYRSGYIDLTRIWMTTELKDWFRHLATVEREIREDIARYENSTLTPMEVGVRIRTHPAMAITAASKMRNSRAARMSYSGRRVQTIVFQHRDPAVVGGNLAAARTLLSDLSAVPKERLGSAHVIRGVGAQKVMDFIDAYRFHPDSAELKSELINRYVETCLAEGELQTWTVAVIGRQPDVDLGEVDLGLGELVGRIGRSKMNSPGDANIKTLMSQVDRAVDLGDETRASIDTLGQDQLASLRNTPERGGRGDGSGLLLLYPIAADSKPKAAPSGSRPVRDERVPLDAVDTLIGVGLVFPETARWTDVEYITVNLSNVPVETLEEGDMPEDDA